MTDWGSIQYQASSQHYDHYWELRNSGKTRDEALQELGWSLTIDRIVPWEEGKAGFLADEEEGKRASREGILRERLELNSKKRLPKWDEAKGRMRYIHLPEEEIRSWTEEERLEDEADLKDLSQAASVGDLFVWARDHGWDLWSAAPVIFAVFVEGELKEVEAHEEIEAGEGWPILNQQIITNDSDRTGIYCALLQDLGLVSDPQVFEDFST